MRAQKNPAESQNNNQPSRTGHSWMRSLVFKGFRGLTKGRLRVSEDNQVWDFGSPADPLQADLRIHHPACYGDIVFGGSVGAAEAYMRGDWSSGNLTSLMQLMAANMPVVGKLESGLAALAQPLRLGIHYLRRNTRQGSRKNIAAHYDLSNAFFKGMLDRRMMYSCAFFPNSTTTLDDASTLKLDRICQKLKLQPSDHLLEIGTGWGGMALFGAKHYGCKVTTTTISKEQHAYAKRAIKEAGLSQQITLLMSDYRDLEGHYDKLVSIEMIEAVGHQFLTSYFQTCSRLLKPEGTMLIQAITIPDVRYASALREVDFIKKFIFPGSFIPSIGAMVKASSTSTDLQLNHLEDQTPHYAMTLAKWRENFQKNLHDLPEHLNNTTFKRMWDFYLAYCEGGFRERVIGSAQLMFSKPHSHFQTPLITFDSMGSLP